LTDQTGALTIFYDGACPLCTAEMSVYRKCAGAGELAFVDVSAHDLGLVGPDLEKANALKRFHVRLTDGSFVSGAAGFGHLWLALPVWQWLGRVVLLPGMLEATEVVYRGFLVVRPALQQIWRAKSSTRAQMIFGENACDIGRVYFRIGGGPLRGCL
jgi:predicted DCC family thiol-disulfide oxidoreductase YuxK